MFFNVPDDKIKEGFFGPEIKQVINDRQFEALLVGPDRTARKAFNNVSENFLGNYRAPNYMQLDNNTNLPMG